MSNTYCAISCCAADSPLRKSSGSAIRRWLISDALRKRDSAITKHGRDCSNGFVVRAFSDSLST